MSKAGVQCRLSLRSTNALYDARVTSWSDLLAQVHSRKGFTEAQIIGSLREAEAGLPVKELCRRHGFSEASAHFC